MVTLWKGKELFLGKDIKKSMLQKNRGKVRVQVRLPQFTISQFLFFKRYFFLFTGTYLTKFKVEIFAYKICLKIYRNNKLLRYLWYGTVFIMHSRLVVFKPKTMSHKISLYHVHPDKVFLLFLIFQGNLYRFHYSVS